ncbi:asparagine synthase-related protein [Nonomuraea sp. N2-4H]|uniref:asparagine synthase-related protein n=1 Tax=Nonomuraea sp. N2-4H TaxID=3128898 RepID=UPI003250C70E
MQTRQVFHAMIDGVRVLCDRADVLSELGGLPLDEIALGLRLARGLPYPADRLPMWQGVSAVPGPQYVLVRRDGREAEQRTWWRRPEPRLTRADGAALLRDALETAVRVRTETEADIACDLSGGLDSTPLCYFAARGPKGVIARTFYTDDPGGREDLEWARRALPAMPGVHTHDVFSAQGLPGFYEGLYDLAIPMDEPTQAGAAIPRIRHMLADDVERGVTIHINGLGGDHLLRGVKAWNHTLMRARPFTAWSRSRAEDAPMGIGPLSTLRQLMDRRTYRQWYLATVRDAARGVEPPELPRINDWSVPLSLPDWLTADARASMLDRLRRLGAEATPLGTGLAGHFDVFTVQQAGRLARSMGLVGQSLGVSYDAPLLDDHVVEAVFQVRYEERDSPIEWKPLMKAAMTGLLPDDYLRRTTKIGGAPTRSAAS